VSLIVLGLNHRTVALEVLERTTIDDPHVAKALVDLTSRDHLSEAAVLSTCNRTEVYAMAERFHGAVDDIVAFLSDWARMPFHPDEGSIYIHHDDGAAAHLFGVAAGLDSAVLGESEILGQVRRAWERAHEEGAVGPTLNAAFRHAVEVGKRARTETGIGRHVTSVSQAAVAMAADRLGGLEGRRVLVLGAGGMGKGIATALRTAHVSDVLVCNRTWDRALELAEVVGGRPVPLLDLPTALAEVDLLLTSTGASSIMVEHGDLEPVMASRGPDHPLLIVDVAVPRDVDPSAGDLPGVTLLDMTDLQTFAAQGLEKRQREIGKVEEIIEEEVTRWVETNHARRASPLVAALRSRAEEVRTSELERLAGRLTDLDDRQREAVEALTRGIVGKLLHDPTVRLKDAVGTARGERLAEALRDLFDL
jgi:glutamyl-tRNA reductase